MTHDDKKELQEASLIGRLLSMEALILLMGFLSLVYGISNGKEINIFWGVIIIVGSVVLYKVRRKDWKKHWEEMEAEQKAREAYAKRKAAGTAPPKEKDGE